jgi:hypothetical protein
MLNPAQAHEIIWWARGVQMGDKRISRSLDNVLLAAEFWASLEEGGLPFLRGCIDGSGVLILRNRYNEKSHHFTPLITIYGSPMWLTAITDAIKQIAPDWMVQLSGLRKGMRGECALLERQIPTGQVEQRGVHAQHVVDRIWASDDVCTFPSQRVAAREIRGWAPFSPLKGKMPWRYPPTQVLVDVQFLRSMVKPRQGGTK